MQRKVLLILACTFVPLWLSPAWAADEPSFTRKEDVIYGRKHGTALTMDVFTPKKDANGAAVIFVVSGGWFSAHQAINLADAGITKRGYTVFAVVHAAAQFTIPKFSRHAPRRPVIRHHARTTASTRPHRHHRRLRGRALSLMAPRA